MDKTSFRAKRLVVMGGTKGIGKELVLSLAERGASVAACGRDAGSLAAIEAALSSRRVQHFIGRCDVKIAKDVDQFISEAAATIGGIDILVNCASSFSRADDEAGWAESIAVDLLGTIRACQAAEPYLRKSLAGCIINIASVAALQPTPARAPYGATKAAVVHLSATLALKLAAFGIRVNCIMPGSTDFEGGIWDSIRLEQPEVYERTRASIPFGRFGAPSDIVKAIEFLASDDAGWITGQSLVVDGGQTLVGF